MHHSSMWNKKPTRCYLVLYLFLLCKLLNMFRANLCPSSGAGDLVVFLPRGVVPWLCMLWIWPPTQPWHYTTRGKNCARYSPMDTQPANRIWPPTQPRHYTTRGKNTTKQSAPEDGHNLARNMLSKLQRRNKYNTKWHLVGFLFHIELRCTVNHTSNSKVNVFSQTDVLQVRLKRFWIIFYEISSYCILQSWSYTCFTGCIQIIICYL